MIDSAKQYAVHELLSGDNTVQYRVPPYQREYSWQKLQWEDLFQDLVEAGASSHFLGTIITLNKTTDALDGGVLELVDGQQRMTTLTLLLAAIHAVLDEHRAGLDDDTRTDLTNLGRRLVRRSDGEVRLTLQTQGNNRSDYRAVLAAAGLPVEETKRAYFSMRRIARCFAYFREAIATFAETEQLGIVQAALKILDAAKNAVIVKIEVGSHADAFVLFESLNNRGMPLTPVDLIKNYLLAESDREDAMDVDEAFGLWSGMLANLGDNYATQERFLRHYFNAFRSELPDVPNAAVATRAKLIRIYEKILIGDVRPQIDMLVRCSRLYGRITCAVEPDDRTALDDAFRRLLRAQGAPSYVLLMWIMREQASLEVDDRDLGTIADTLTSFFVRRNLTGSPQTYRLPKLFMTIIDDLVGRTGDNVCVTIASHLSRISDSDEAFAHRLHGRIYEENSDVARFILTILAEDAMTKETRTDLWALEKNHYVWTIEHILPQGANLPKGWTDMLGGTEAAAVAQSAHVHRLGNLTITAYNSSLSNKSFVEKRDRTDSAGRAIGYRNGLSLNSDLAARSSWTVEDIEARTTVLTTSVLVRFPLT